MSLIYRIALLWLLLAPAPASFGTSTNVLVFVAGSATGLEASYWTDRQTLSRQRKWVPGGEVFPADLNHLIDLGRGELLTVRKITNNFLLDEITIRRIPSLGRALPASEAEFSGRWAVSLQFSLTPPAGSTQPWYERVVLLFDGSLAEERFASAREIHEAQLGNIPIPARRSRPSPDAFPPDVPLSPVEFGPDRARSSRWRPGEPFPIDLSAAVAAATACLREKFDIQKAFLLNELAVWGVEVTDSPDFPSLWAIGIRLCAKDDGIRTYSALVLLDGSVVECAETATPSTQKAKGK